MYDLAARDRKEIPSDLDDIMMYSEIGNMARYAWAVKRWHCNRRGLEEVYS